MNKYSLKFLIREAIQEKDDKDLINASISYLVKGNDFTSDPGILLFAKAILCDKRNGKNRDYNKINPEGLELSKMALDKVEQIKGIDPELFKEMVKDGSNRKYRKMVDTNNKIIIIGE